jgi:hypothetical protein
VVTGRSTRIDDFGWRGPAAVQGKVVTTEDEQPVSRGQVLVTAWKGGTEETRAFGLAGDGRFAADVRDDADEVEAYYLPAPGYGDASERLRRA